jgi:hypothetical protein
MTLMFCVAAFGALTYNDEYYRKNLQSALSGSTTADPIYLFMDEVDGIVGGGEAIAYSTYTATDTEPGTTAGMLYYDLSDNKFRYYNGSGWVAIEAGASADSLDAAYSIGQTMTVDAGAVTLTATNPADNVVLALAQSDTGTTKGMTITNAGTGNTLDIQGQSSSKDIEGTDDTWSVTSAGVGTFVGLVSSTGDVTLTGAAYDIIHDASANQIEFQDSAELSFGTGDDISIVYDGAGDDLDITGSGLEIAIGADDEGMDVIFHGETASTYAMWDESADEIVLELADLKVSSDSQIEIEDDAGTIDWTIDNATDETLLIYPTETTDDQSINLGNATNTTDLRIFGATASTVIFDASADNVLFNAYDIQLQDDDVLAFGDGKDVIISQSSANLLTVGQTVAGTGSVAFGVDDAGLDLKLFGDTASAYWLWDTSADTMEVVGGNATITTDDAEADQFKVDATGTVAGDAINFETTDGGILLNADGGSNGDIEINSADDVIITSAGKVTITNTEAVTISGAQTTAGIATFNGTIVGDGATTVVGTKAVETTDIDDETITIAQSGTCFNNTGDADGATYTLPEASTALGCWYTFVVTETGQQMIIELDNADVFLHLTLDAGDQMQSSTLGDTITVMAVSPSQWAVISVYPLAADWADGGA